MCLNVKIGNCVVSNLTNKSNFDLVEVVSRGGET